MTPIADWRRLMREPVFLRHLAIGTALSGALYVFLAASPFLLVDVYHADPRHLGLPYGLVALGAGGKCGDRREHGGPVGLLDAIVPDCGADLAPLAPFEFGDEVATVEMT